MITWKYILIVSLIPLIGSFSFAANPPATTSAPSNDIVNTFNQIYSDEVKSLKPEFFPYFIVKLISDTDSSTDNIPLSVYMLDKSNEYFNKISSTYDNKNEIAVYLAKKFIFFGQKYIDLKDFDDAKKCFNKANTLFAAAKSPLQPAVQIYNKLADLLILLNDKPDDIETLKKLFILSLVELNDLKEAANYAKLSKFEIYNEYISILSKKAEINISDGITREQCKAIADFYKEQMNLAIDKSNCQIMAIKYYSLLIDDMAKDKKKDASYLINTKNLENVRKTTTMTIITETKNMKMSDKMEAIKKMSKEQIAKEEEIKKMFVGKWNVRYSNNATRTYLINNSNKVLFIEENINGTLVNISNNIYGIDWGDGKYETIELNNNKLEIKHYNPKTNYPDKPPTVVGVGVKG